MCPVCWISGFIAVLFGGSFIATINHPLSWGVGIVIIAYGVYKFYDGYKRGKSMEETIKSRNKKIIYRFIQGIIVGSIITGAVFYKFTADEHKRMHQLLEKHGIENHDH